YNNPFGAWPGCEGYGRTWGIDEDKVIPDQTISIYEKAVAAWTGEKGLEWLNEGLRNAHKLDLPVHKPYRELTQEQKDLLWEGSSHFEGINKFFEMLEAQTYKIQNRVMLARFRGKTKCHNCKGFRLRKEALYVKIAGLHIGNLMNMPID